MSLRKLSVGLVVGLALGAVLASSASAAVSTTRAEWYVGAALPTLPTGVSKVVKTKLTPHGELETKISFESKIAGLPIKFTATGLECVSCLIQNKEITEKAGAAAWGEGKFKFTGVTVDSPTGCHIADESGTVGQIITKTLLLHGDWMDTNAANQHAFLHFFPKAGVGTTFAQFKLTAGNCVPIASTYNITGSLYGESVNNTGVAATVQDVVFSPTVQTTAGVQPVIGGNGLDVTGTVGFELSPNELFTIKP